jgi:hypothetical protein
MSRYYLAKGFGINPYGGYEIAERRGPWAKPDQKQGVFKNKMSNPAQDRTALGIYCLISTRLREPF